MYANSRISKHVETKTSRDEMIYNNVKCCKILNK